MQINMKVSVFVFVCLVVHGTSAPLHVISVVRVPNQDSAIIQSERLGGNFVYSTIEGHAYAAVSPIVQNLQTPTAVNYAVQPIVTHMQLPVYAAQYGSANLMPSTSILTHK